MKIHNKTKFAFGILFIIISILWVVLCIARNELEYKHLLLIPMMLFFGIIDIKGSVHRVK